MRLAQIVTFLDAAGSYGGPSSVALAQSRALVSRGHAVTLFAAAPPEEVADRVVDGVRVVTFPAKRIAARLGFAGMYASGMLGSPAFREEYDLVHVHAARDLVTLPGARSFMRRGTPVVLQPHGMLDAPQHPLAAPVDWLLTRRVARAAEAIIVLTDDEENGLGVPHNRGQIRRLGNGVQVPAHLPDLSERPITALFLARLHPRKRPVEFVELAGQLRREYPEGRFVLAGPDEGELAAVHRRNAALGYPVEIIGAVDRDRVPHLMRSARVYVLPSHGEVFPMTMIEAFVAGTPVVATDSLGIAAACLSYGAAEITDGSVERMAHKVRTLINDDSAAEKLRAGAARYLRAELDVAHVAAELETIYVNVAKGSSTDE